ncbi:uncharacterized protein CDAR_492331 [Caerostris darwini]|uniref:Uncharacterized protein n=1 Tax=Caerostris darwini TaxID=1538125 RepID=A0AAV4UYR4_9ARAC|nr:uncharacterized protein CDAR_492331 [Caerostris darwini]
MESVNQSIKNSLHFISIIQEICEKRRLYVESLNWEEYNKYVKEWKREQKSLIKVIPRQAELPEEKQTDGDVITEEMEELTLVDALLEKARNIRMKNKDLLKEIKGTTHKSQLSVESFSHISKSNELELQCKRRLCKNVKDSSDIEKILPRSKSALTSSTAKATVVPRSKSAHTCQISKEKVLRINEPGAKINCKKNMVTFPSKKIDHKLFDECNSAVISSKDLHEFKKSSNNHNDCDKKLYDKSSIVKLNTASSSDCSDVSNHQSYFPNFRRFKNDLKQTFNTKSCFEIHKSVVWYPFISPKNRDLLCTQRKFYSLENFNKALKTINRIQEIMMWIDLLSLIGSTLASLHLLDKNDWEVIHLCSCLESICRGNLQRIPILNPD